MRSVKFNHKICFSFRYNKIPNKNLYMYIIFLIYKVKKQKQKKQLLLGQFKNKITWNLSKFWTVMYMHTFVWKSLTNVFLRRMTYSYWEVKVLIKLLFFLSIINVWTYLQKNKRVVSGIQIFFFGIHFSGVEVMADTRRHLLIRANVVDGENQANRKIICDVCKNIPVLNEVIHHSFWYFSLFVASRNISSNALIPI